MRRIFLFVFMGLFSTFSYAAGKADISTVYPDSAAEEFGVQRLTEVPVLLTDKQPALCNAVLDAVKYIYVQGDAELDYSSIVVKHLGMLKWRPLPGDGGSNLRQLTLDLDGTRKKQVVIFRTNTFNWEGDWHYAYVFSSVAAFKKYKDKIISAWAQLPQDSQYPSVANSDFGEHQYYPSALLDNKTEVQTGNVWGEINLFAWHKRYYFFPGTTPSDRRSQTQTTLFQLHANGTVTQACQIGLHGGKAAYARFLAMPGVDSFLKIIRIIGAGGEDDGTMHSGAIHDDQSLAAEKRAATRPWAVSIASGSMTPGHPYYVYDDRSKAFLEDWSFLGIWSRREYQTFLEHIAPAERGVAEYLRTSFGVPPQQAKAEAVQVVTQLIGARLLVPNEFNGDQASRDLYFGKYSLSDAIISRNKAMFDTMLKDLVSSRKSNVIDLHQETVLSRALANAVEWPYALKKLLQAGANPNYKDGAGRTALMVAAHMDRPDSVEILLKAHTDVNALTQHITVRSALTYAAENASPIVMRQLLEAGADPAVTDANGNNIGFYLRKNPRLTLSEKAMGVVRLAKIANKFSGPGFRCHDARTVIEKTICSSEMLSSFDFEMARAYKILHDRLGNPVRVEQRRWLKRRNTLCDKSAMVKECLAEIMRTHVRYLHDRIGEDNPT